MTCTDDLYGLFRAERIARVQAVVREHGDRLTEAAQALSLCATQIADDLQAALARHQHKITDRMGERRVGCLSDWLCPDLVLRRYWQSEVGA